MYRLLNLPIWRQFTWNTKAYFLEKKKKKKKIKNNAINVSSG